MQQTCQWCGAKRRSVRTWRDHLAKNECGLIPASVSVETILAYADSYSEAEWVATLIPFFRSNGWDCYHVPQAEVRPGRWVTNTTEAGLPDWLLIRPPDLVIIEAKRQKNSKATKEQVHVIRSLQNCRRILAGFARPTDAATLLPIALHGLVKNTKQEE